MSENKSIAEILKSAKYFGSVEGKVVEFYKKKVGDNDVYDVYLEDGSKIDDDNAKIKVGVWNPNYSIENGIYIKCWGLYTKEYNGNISLNMKKDGSGSKIIEKIVDTGTNNQTKKKENTIVSSTCIPFEPGALIEEIQKVDKSIQEVRDAINALAKNMEMKESESLVTVLKQFKEIMKKFIPETGE